jgi:hypothetical protein
MKMHPSFKLPKNLDSKIWRYIDFTKYVSMLATSSLFFARADNLNDNYEGALPKQNQKLKNELREMWDLDNNTTSTFDIYSEVRKHERKSIAICCWHLSEHESAAMWKLYLNSGEGVAVQTTVRKLLDCLENVLGVSVFSGMVDYTNYETEYISESNLFNLYMNKRNSFEFEKEFRSVFCRFPKSGTIISKNDVAKHFETIEEGGENIKVDIKSLIEKVVVSPHSQVWFEKLVRTITEKYEFYFDIENSKLKEPPVF